MKTATREREVAGWGALEAELDRWSDVGRVATFWWRDDDACEPTPQLEALLRCAGPIAIALAVVPGKATPELAERLRTAPTVAVLQHGWRHESYRAGGRNEYPAERPRADVARELEDGRERLERLFGEQAIPVFAPPWHGLDESFLSLFPDCGLRAISRKGRRPSAFAAPGVFQANAHVAPIQWSNPPSYEGDEAYLGQLVDHLRARRIGSCEPSEHTGLLTHHLDQNAASFAFIARLAELVSSHASAKWIGPRQVFEPALAS